MFLSCVVSAATIPGLSHRGPVRMRWGLEWSNSICSKWICFVKKRIWRTKWNVEGSTSLFAHSVELILSNFHIGLTVANICLCQTWKTQSLNSCLQHISNRILLKKQIELGGHNFVRPWSRNGDNNVNKLIAVGEQKSPWNPFKRQNRPIILLKVEVVHWNSQFSRPSNPRFPELTKIIIWSERKT